MFARALLVLAAAIAFVVLPLGTALAAPATATTAVNVRSGPGSSNAVVGSLAAGERVEMGRCTGGWCQITRQGTNGWVYSKYLAVGGGGARPTPSPQPDVGFCISAGDISFGVNCTPPPTAGRPGFPSPWDRVCFYEHENFRGRSFCARPGEQNAHLSSSWRRTISSIQISGNAKAVVCDHTNFNGWCATVTSSVRRVAPHHNDTIASYRVSRR